MRSEADEIAPDEWVVRRVHGQYFPRIGSPGFSTSAFAPQGPAKRHPDTDGISLYRLDCLSYPAQALLTVPSEKRINGGLVQFTVCEFLSEGFSVKPMPCPPIPGHVVIPEINCKSYDFQTNPNDAKRIDAFLDHLARIAHSPGRVLIWPTLPGIQRP